jgi:hypothetical protein
MEVLPFQQTHKSDFGFVVRILIGFGLPSKFAHALKSSRRSLSRKFQEKMTRCSRSRQLGRCSTQTNRGEYRAFSLAGFHFGPVSSGLDELD